MRTQTILSFTVAAVTAAWSGCSFADTASDASLAQVAKSWAAATYSTPAPKKLDAYKAALADAEHAVSQYPMMAEPKIWQAIILAGLARAQGGLGALGEAKQSRDLLLEAEKIDATAMDGSIYATLGSLYAKVPGWPIGFGDKKKARACFEKALAIDAFSLDSNFFYADFLAEEGDYRGASEHLERALAAPPRIGREDADQGRREEVTALLSQLRQKHAAALAAS